MSDSKIFNALNIAAIQFNERACVFDNKIILADNSDDGDRPHDLTTDPTMLPFLSAPYPFKIQFSIIELCLAGSMRVRMNLNEYELHRNTLMIVTPGAIGQCLEVSPDCRIAIIAVSNDYVIAEENSEGALIIRKFLARQSLLELSDAQTAEILAIYRALRDKLRQPDFRFKHHILKGYLQVLYGEVCQLMTPRVEELDTRQGSRKSRFRPLSRRAAAALRHRAQRRVLRRQALLDTEIPLAGDPCRQRAPRRGVDPRLRDPRGQGPAQKRAIYGTAGLRHAEFRQPVLLRRLLQEGGRLLADRLQGVVGSPALPSPDARSARTVRTPPDPAAQAAGVWINAIRGRCMSLSGKRRSNLALSSPRCPISPHEGPTPLFSFVCIILRIFPTFVKSAARSIRTPICPGPKRRIWS